MYCTADGRGLILLLYFATNVKEYADREII